MIYSKDIPSSCSYCKYGKLMNNKKYVICSKKGVVLTDSKCGKYRYDPLKREPFPRPIRKTFSDDDFSL